jgi:hypothetical protein
MREVISPLAAWDVAAGSAVTLEPGAILYSCRIHRHSHAETETGSEVYVMEFQSSGRRYAAPLCRFQPRTQAVDLVWVEGIPVVEHALACPAGR